MAQGHSVDDYIETIYFLAFPVGEYRPAAKGAPTLAVRVADMLGEPRPAFPAQFGRHAPAEKLRQNKHIALAHPQRRQGDDLEAQPI